MNALTAAWGLGAAAVLAWMVSRLVRAPRDVPLWAVTGLVASWAAAYPFMRASGAQEGLLGLPPLQVQLIATLLMLSGMNCIVYFFLFSALDLPQARRRALWYLPPLVVVVVIQIVTTRLTPAGADTKDHTVTSLFVFFLTGALYTVFVFSVAWVWTRRYARKAGPRLARGLRIASYGEAGIVLGDLLYVPMLFLRWINGDNSPTALDPDNLASTLGFVAGAFFLQPGAVLLLIGVSYSSVSMRVAAVGVWWQHLRAYRRLRPLWALLHRHFPEDALGRVPTSRLGDVLNPRAVHRRYYRRVIECRDGLVHISPYLAAVRAGGDDGSSAEGGGGGGPAPAVVLAGQLRQALRARTAGEPVSTAAVPVIVPDEGNLTADVEELVALSQALRNS